MPRSSRPPTYRPEYQAGCRARTEPAVHPPRSLPGSRHRSAQTQSSILPKSHSSFHERLFPSQLEVGRYDLPPGVARLERHVVAIRIHKTNETVRVVAHPLAFVL